MLIINRTLSSIGVNANMVIIVIVIILGVNGTLGLLLWYPFHINHTKIHMIRLPFSV